MSRPLRHLIAGLCALALIFLVGVGYVNAGGSLLDSVYLVIVTIFSGGYGEVRPIDSPGLMVFTALIIILGCTTVIYLMGAFIQFLTEGQILNALGGRRMIKEVSRLSNHVIVCGFGRVGRQIIAELESAGRDLVVIVRDLVGAVRRTDGSSIHKPPLDARLTVDDTLIVMCHQRVIPDFTERLYPKRQILYRGASS